MKMREWLDSFGEMGKALTCKGGGLDYFTTVLDAEVIGLPCPTCGGSGKCKDIWAGAVREVACPDCADTPVWVIAPEAMEAAIREGWLAYHQVIHGAAPDEGLIAVTLYDGGLVHDSYVKNMGALVSAALQALLPGARVAEEIGSFTGGDPDSGGPAWVGETVLDEGTSIAVLAKQEEVEE